MGLVYAALIRLVNAHFELGTVGVTMLMNMALLTLTLKRSSVGTLMYSQPMTNTGARLLAMLRFQLDGHHAW